MTSPLVDRLAREAHDTYFAGHADSCHQHGCGFQRVVAAALRAFQREAARVAREWKCPVEYGVSYRCGAKSDEIAAKIEAL